MRISYGRRECSSILTLVVRTGNAPVGKVVVAVAGPEGCARTGSGTSSP